MSSARKSTGRKTAARKSGAAKSASSGIRAATSRVSAKTSINFSRSVRRK